MGHEPGATRVVVKASGQAFAGDEAWGIDPRAVAAFADEVVASDRARGTPPSGRQERVGVYSDDPALNPRAQRFDTLTFDEVIKHELRVMDPSAFILARDHQVPIAVFDSRARGAMASILRGEPIGTTISRARSASTARGRHPATGQPTLGACASG